MTEEDKILLEEWIENNIIYTFSHSGGPGGQNVNKVSTKVCAKLKLSGMPVLDEKQIGKIYEKLKNKINSEGELVIQVQDERKQKQNVDIALSRMKIMIFDSLKKRKKRIKTKTPKSVKEKRIKDKKITGQKKKNRKSPKL